MDQKNGFEWALCKLREGKKVARAGWNGKGMWLVLQKGYPTGIAINQNTAEATGIPQGTECRFLPYLMLKTVQSEAFAGPCFVPWLASQSDLLEQDWELAN